MCAFPCAGKTPLHEAAQAGNVPCVELLLGAGAVGDAHKVSTARLAATSGGTYWLLHAHTTLCISLFLSLAHVVVTVRPQSNGWTPLMYAAYKGSSAVVRLLVKHRSPGMASEEQATSIPPLCACTTPSTKHQAATHARWAN